MSYAGDVFSVSMHNLCNKVVFVLFLPGSGGAAGPEQAHEAGI